MYNFNNDSYDMARIKKVIHKKMVSLIICSIIIVGLVTTFAYITYFGDNTKRMDADLKTGTMGLVFEDRDNGINASLQLGETITKKFSIKNVGSLTGLLSFDWVNMVNTYGYRSLSYNLEYCTDNCDSEEAQYIKIMEETNMPVSSKPLTQPLASEISVPASATYYYRLNITLNDLEDVDQTGDLDAIFTTNFAVGEASKYRYYTLRVDPNGGVWNNFVEPQEYKLKNLDTKQIEDPVRDGYNFLGWDISGLTSSLSNKVFSMGISDSSLVAKWDIKKHNIIVIVNGEEKKYELGLGESLKLEKPNIEGKTFVSWDVSSGSIIDDIFTLTTDCDVTINAVFSDNVYNYKVIHRQMNVTGNGYDIIDIENGHLAYGEVLRPEVKTYMGFTSPNQQTIEITVDEEDPSKNVITYDYVRNQYTLTIDSNGGSYPSNSEILMYFGANINLETPVKDGYVFGGWDKTAGEVNDNKFVMGAEDAKITAKWINGDFDYIVHHSLMNTDGLTYSIIESENGKAEYDSVITPNVRSYKGFTSPSQSSLTIKSDSRENVLNYLYSRNKYDLIINPNGGYYENSNDNVTKSLFYESSIDLEIPRRDGYTFAGWSNEGGSLLGQTLTMSDTNTVTLTANWNINSYTATVNYFQMNLDGETYSLVDSSEVIKDFGSQFSPSIKEYVGFTAPERSSIVIGSNVSENVINYYYSRNKYTLTIDPFGGTYDESTGEVTKSLFFGESIDLGTASKVGYVFSRWKKATADNGELSGNIFTMKDSDITLIAVYTPQTFTVTFNANGGTVDPQSKVITYDSVYDELPKPHYEGYEFLGWFTEQNGGIEITSSTKVSILENQNLYAHWRYATYTINFDANGGSVDIDSKEVSFGDTYGDLPIATKDNYNFIGWFTDKETGSLIDSNSIVELRENHTLYAHYSVKPGPDGTLDILGNNVKDGTPNFVNVSPPATITYTNNSSYKDFESVTNDNTYPWNYDESSGTYTSTNKVHSSTSTIIFHLDKPTHMYLFYTASSQASYDLGNVYIDNVRKGYYSGSSSGYLDLGELTPENEIKITYRKNASTSSYNDQFQFILSDDVSSNDDTGLYSLEDDYGTSYYYRGGVINNYVKFAGFYWRIVRMNGDGSLRIMFDGNQAYNNGTGNIDRLALNGQTWNSTFNNDNKYLGYMYGGANGSVTSSKEEAQTNETSANIKTQLENWYWNNIGGYGLDKYVSDSIFCNDRSTADVAKTWWTSESATPGFKTNITAYGSFSRFLLTTGGWNTTNPSPSFKCSQKNDAFTKEDTIKGNGNLSQKVGTVTADEIVAAGSGINKNNTKYYMYKGYIYYAMSPNRYNNGGYVSIVNANGGFSYQGLTTASYLVPVINLAPEYVVSLKGDGYHVSGGKDGGLKSLGASTARVQIGVTPVINLEASMVPQFYGSGTKNDPYYLK